MATHLYVVLQGAYVGAYLAGETWQTGVRFGASPGSGTPDAIGEFDEFGVVPLNQTVTEATYTITSNWTTEMGVTDLDPVSWLNDQIRTAADDLIGSAQFSSALQLRSILVYPIRSPDGKVEPAPPYAQGSPARLDFTSSQPIGGGSAPLPPQISAVASLRTQQVGRRGRGRMFLPLLTTGTNANGRVDTTAAAALATAVSTFLEACRLSGSGPGGVSVYPVITGAPYTDYAAINSVRVGNVFDTQRRRRAALVEAYSSEPVEPFL